MQNVTAINIKINTMSTGAKVKFTCCIFFMFLYNIGNAQISQPRSFDFKQGDEYQKETSINSTCTIQRGNQKLDINSSSSVTKLYKVTAVTGTNFVFTVSIKKMGDTLSALGQKLPYNSEKPIDDSTSRIEKALSYMINKPVNVRVDKHGTILSKDTSVELANDTLLAFTGIQPELFIEGRTFGLLANFTSNKLKKGYNWTVPPTITAKQKVVTKYWVYAVSDTSTVIKFTSSVTGGSVNSNTNGTYILDKSGIIVERFIQSLSAGYAVIGKTIYATTRSSSIHETCRKMPSSVFAQIGN
jgi:hypothetical protein